MTLRFQNHEDYLMVLPRDEQKLMHFLFGQGFVPRRNNFDSRVIELDKDFEFYPLVEKWQKFLGVDKTIAAVVNRQR